MAQLDWENNRCFVCGSANPDGLHIIFDGDEHGVVGRITISDKWQGFSEMVHGGILAGIMDDALWHAIYHKQREVTVTAELTIRYLRPVPTNKELTVTAQTVKVTPRLTSAEATINLGKDVLVRGSGRFMPPKATP